MVSKQGAIQDRRRLDWVDRAGTTRFRRERDRHATHLQPICNLNAPIA